MDAYWLIGGKPTDSHLFIRQNYGPGDVKRSSLADSLWNSSLNKDESVDLVLGILTGGASFLLVPDLDRHGDLIDRRRRDRRPILGNAFESLSPISFDSKETLEAKLLTYNMPTQKSQRKAAAQGGHPISKTNPAQYFHKDSRSKRPWFEHNRVLLKLLLDDISQFDGPRTFGLPNRPLHTHVRFVALAANDFEGHAEEVLDIGWQGLAMEEEDGERQITRAEIQHFDFNKSGLRKNGESATEFEGGTTLKGREHDVASLLQMALQPDEDESVVVLCCGFGILEPILEKRFGIDTKEWKSELKSLIGYGEVWQSRKQEERVPVNDYFLDVKRRSRSPFRGDERGTLKRERSYSPDQADEKRRRTKDPRQRPQDIKREPPDHTQEQDQKHEIKTEHKLKRPDDHVYVIDLFELFTTMSGYGGNNRSVTWLASRLYLDHLLPKGHTWCAGNEGKILFDLWYALVSTVPIDERREVWISTNKEEETRIRNKMDDEEREREREFKFQNRAPSPPAPLNFNRLLAETPPPAAPPPPRSVPVNNPYASLEDSDDSDSD